VGYDAVVVVAPDGADDRHLLGSYVRRTRCHHLGSFAAETDAQREADASRQEKAFAIALRCRHLGCVGEFADVA